MGIILLRVLRCRLLSDRREVSLPLRDIPTVPEGEAILLRTVEAGRGNTR